MHCPVSVVSYVICSSCVVLEQTACDIHILKSLQDLTYKLQSVEKLKDILTESKIIECSGIVVERLGKCLMISA